MLPRPVRFVPAALLAGAAVLNAQQQTPPAATGARPMPGYSTSAAARERAVEAA
ncbi:MAG: hypothetical protein JWM27_588, partial [Gemmatimonadetes bacterium]|nr:hypothetical protein [Gemmatimonadota bacterium]